MTHEELVPMSYTMTYTATAAEANNGTEGSGTV